MVSEERESMSGWLTFAGVILIVAGLFNFIDGLIAIANAAWFSTATGRAIDLPIIDNLAVWGWVVLVLGVLAAATGIGVLYGAMAARVVGVVLAGLNMLVQFAWLTHFPLWSLTMIGLDVVVIYALVAPTAAVRPQQMINLHESNTAPSPNAVPRERTSSSGV